MRVGPLRKQPTKVASITPGKVILTSDPEGIQGQGNTQHYNYSRKLKRKTQMTTTMFPLERLSQGAFSMGECSEPALAKVGVIATIT